MKRAGEHTVRVAPGEAIERLYIIDGETDIALYLDSGAKARVVALAVGNAAGRLRVELVGEGAEAHLYGLFIAGAGERATIRTEVEHAAAGCSSTQDFRGVAAADGRGAFDGLIRVAPDAQRTQAFQSNHNLLLGGNAMIESRPQLEIYADDVKCSHGATTGQLDPQALFYMRQRGLDAEQARKLQLLGFVRTIVERIADPADAARADTLVTQKIDRL